MKKQIVFIIFFIIISVLFISAFTYATHLDKYAKIIDSDDINLSSETTKKDNKDNKVILINNQNLNVEYKNSKNEKDIYIDTHTNDEYIFIDEKLVGYKKDININDLKNAGTKVDMEKAKNIAEQFGEKYIENFKMYDLFYSNYTDSYNEYCYIYMKKLNEIETQDTIQINVNGQGDITSYSAFHQGEFEKFKEINIDKELIKEQALEFFKGKYEENYKEANISSEFLRLIDGKLVMQIDAIIKLNSDNNKEISFGDSIFYNIY